MPVGTGAYQVPTQTRRVTTLAPAGSGSLAEAISTDAIRAGAVIEFDVAGNINRINMSDLIINQPGIQIMGETAPGNGVNLVGCGIRMKSNGGILSGFRIIAGDKNGIPSPDNRDCIGVEGEGQPIEDITIRNMTMAYSIDGLLDLYSTRIKRVSIIDNIFAEPLDASTHPSGNHSTALLISKGTDVLVARNLFVHWRYRSPAIRGPSNVGFVNNLLYNPRDALWLLYGSDSNQTGGTILAAFIGNHAMMGLNCPWFRTSPVGFFEVAQSNMSVWTSSRVYLNDNITTSAQALIDAHSQYSNANAWPTSTPVLDGLGYTIMTNSNPIDLGSLTPMASSAVKAYVLANAGPKDTGGVLRSTLLETRIRSEVTNGATGTLKDTVPAAEAAYFGFRMQSRAGVLAG